MNVLHVVTRPQKRGAETVALELSAEMERIGLHSLIIALAPGGTGNAIDGIDVLQPSEALGGASSARAAWRLRRRLRSSRPNIVLAHGGSAALVSVLAGLGSGIPIVWQRIAEFPTGVDSGWRRKVWSFVARRVQAVVSITQESLEATKELGFEGASLVEPNHRPVERFDAARASADPVAYRAKLGIRPGMFVLAFVGHMVDQKRPLLALDVFRGLYELDIHLLMAGDGPLLEAAIRKADQLGIADKITFMGHVDDVPGLLCSCDAILLTSSMEVMTGTMVEAQMCGCPVVTFDLQGMDLLIKEGSNGYIVEMDDIAEMIERIKHMYADPFLHQQLSDHSIEIGRAFSTENAVQRYVDMLEAVVLAAVVDRS